MQGSQAPALQWIADISTNRNLHPLRHFAQRPFLYKISFVQPIRNFTKTIDKIFEIV